MSKIEKKRISSKNWNDKNKEYLRLYRLKNKEKTKIYNKNYKKSPKIIFTNKIRKIGVNFTFIEYNNLLEKQNNRCAICKNICKSGRSLAIDHNHSTGKVRGLLCMKCNSGLGSFNDNVELLNKAIKYLK